MFLLLADGILFLALIAAPLLYGSVGFFPSLFLAFLSVILFNGICIARPGALAAVFRSPWTWLGLGFLCFIGFQLVPLPAEWVRKISPGTYSFYAAYLPGGVRAGTQLTLSVYPSDTVRGLIQFLTYGVFFSSVYMRLAPDPSGEPEYHPLSLQKSEYLKLGCLVGVLSLLFHSLYDFNLHVPANGIYLAVLLALGVGPTHQSYDHTFFRRVVNFVIGFGFLIALFAAIQKYSYTGRIFWVGMMAPNPVGPYYNYDHYAGFMALCSAVAIGKVVASVFHTSFVHRKDVIEKILWFATREANQALCCLLMVVVMVGTIFMSTSRGGIMSFVLSQIVFFSLVLWAARRTKKHMRLAGTLIAMVLLISVMVVWLGSEAFLQKFHLLWTQKIVKMEGPIDPRLVFYKDTVPVIQDFPVTGTGFNTFGTNFTRYRTFVWKGEYLRYTHSDYLQLISETGAFGVLFLIGFFILFIGSVARVTKKLD